MTSALIKFCLHNDIPIYATLNFCLNNNIPFLFLRFHRPAFYREQHSEMYSVILYSFVYFLVEVSSERLMARFRRFMYCFRIFRTVLTEFLVTCFTIKSYILMFFVCTISIRNLSPPLQCTIQAQPDSLPPPPYYMIFCRCPILYWPPSPSLFPSSI